MLTGEFGLPQPVPDPITVLTGTQRTVRTGAALARRHWTCDSNASVTDLDGEF